MIRCENLFFGYGQGDVLKGAQLEAPDAAVTALLGPNASGKTTLLRLVVGLHRPHKGRIWVDGNLSSELGKRRAEHVAAVMGEERPEGIEVMQYVIWGALAGSGVLFEGESEIEAAEEALEMVGVSHLARRMIGALSGGEWQRVQIARALAQGANNIVLDEPTAHLDIAHKLKLLETLKALAQNGRCVLLVLHDINSACRFSDRIAVMHKGRIVAEGPPADVITQDLLKTVWRVDAEVIQQNGSIRVQVRSALEDLL